MTRADNGKHQKGIEARIRQLLDKHGRYVLSIHTNVDYKDAMLVPNLAGEIDYMLHYTDGSLLIGEVKSTYSSKSKTKAEEQLNRAGEAYKYFTTEFEMYFVDIDKTFDYKNRKS